MANSPFCGGDALLWCHFVCSWQLFKIVLGFTPRRRPWKAGSSQNDDFLPRSGIYPLQTSLQGTSIPKRFGTTLFRTLCGPSGWQFPVACLPLARPCGPFGFSWRLTLGNAQHAFQPLCGTSCFSWSITSGAESASHALLAPDLSHQEMARQFLLFGKNFIYFVRK